MSNKFISCSLLVLVILLMICQVSAGDVAVNDTDMISSVDESFKIGTNYTIGENSDLQKCIDSANDGDTIILNGSYYLDNTVNIDKAISLVGVGDGALIKKDDFSIYKIRYLNITSSNVVLNNIKFVEGTNQYGGAIYWSGDNGSIINCQFEDNIVVNGGSGGAIMVTGNNIYIDNSSFTNNRATLGMGGALSIHGDGAIIRNCQFDDNKVDNGSAGVISVFSNNCLIENCNFTNNYCSDFGGALVISNKSNKILNSLFKNNYVNNNVSGGGAIFSDCENLVIDNSTFLVNHAYNAFGGAVYLSNSGSIRNSYFKDNMALFGNAIYTSSLSLITSNYFALKYNETELQAVFGADSLNESNTFEVIKEDSTVTFIASMVFEYASSGSIYVTVEGGSIELENISVLNHTEAKITFNDNILVVSNLTVGTYILRVITTPDEAHNSVESFLPITVKKATAVIKATKITVALKKGTLWTIKIVNSQTNKAIANMKLTLKVYTGKTYKTVSLITNSKGEASYQTKNLAKGSHKVVVSATHEGYTFNTIKSSINVIKPTPLTYKVKRTTNEKGALLSITVYKKSSKKPINGVKVKLVIYTGKKYQTVVLKTKTKSGYKGVCGYGTNSLSVGTHKVIIKPVNIKYSGSTSSKMKITKTAKKYPSWTKKISG